MLALNFTLRKNTGKSIIEMLTYMENQLQLIPKILSLNNEFFTNEFNKFAKKKESSQK